MRVLIDESLPRQLARLLPGHDARMVQTEGWSAVKNGELLRRAVAVGLRAAVAIRATEQARAHPGGDAGEGLDLDGNIIYAVNVRGPGNLKVRDALFTDQAGQPNVVVSAGSEILSWQTPEYGSTANDNHLEQIMQSVRCVPTATICRPLKPADVLSL